MTRVNREPESLVRALRDAAYLFEPPHHDRFYQQATRRVRQIRRRRAAATGLAGLVAVGTAGALAFALLPGDAQKHDGLRADATSAAPTVGAPKVTQAQILPVFLEVLSAHNLPTITSGQSPTTWIQGPDVDQYTGAWYVSISSPLPGPHGADSQVSVTAMRGAQTTNCSQVEGSTDGDECSVEALDGGTLVLDESNPDASASGASPGAEAVRRYRWRSPAGDEIDLSVSADAVSDFALTGQQALDVLTDPRWQQLVDQLPGPVCQGGRLTQIPPSTSASAGNELELACSTDGATYPAT